MADEELLDVIAEVGDGLLANSVGNQLQFMRPQGETVARQLFVRSSLTPSSVRRLVAASGDVSMVVVDLLDTGAAEVLREAGWSFWDRRGRLRLWLPEIGYRLDVPTRALVTGLDGPVRKRPVAGVGGVSTALFTLIAPGAAGVRRIARASAITPSTISRARQILIDASLISPTGVPLVPELFWALSDAWVPRPVSVRHRPLGGEWVLAGDAAAAHWGAPVFAARERYYCGSRREFDTFVYLHRSETDTGIEVAVAPTPLVLATARGGIADPVVAALDLSRSSRGREVLHDWSAIGGAAHDDDALGGVVWQ